MALQTAVAVDASKQSRMLKRRGSLLWIVLVALTLRLLVMCFLYPERIDPYRDHWRFGGEAGRIARSIAQGEGYSNPLFTNTGPTSWLAPAFPYVLAGVFKIFGVYTKASAIAILSLDCLISALTCIPIYFIAKKQFGNRTALWAGWGWALFPYAIFFSAYFVWATTLTTLLMTLVFLSALWMETSSSPWRWAIFGVLSGLGGLSDPVVMSVAPFLGAWAWHRLHKSGRRSFAPAATAVVAVLLTTSPWFIRNYEAFHKFIPFRSCLGLEVYCGNNADSWHWGPPGYHPSDNENEWREYQQLGEIAYTQKKFDQGLEFIETHPATYARQTLRRVIYLWTGFWSFGQRYLNEEPADPPNIVFCTALTILTLTGLHRAWKTNPNTATPYIIVFLFFPIIYYLTHPEDYYRRPIDPEFVILAALMIAGNRKAAQRSEKREQDPEPVLVEVER